MINYWMGPKYLQYLKRYTLHCGIKTQHKKIYVDILVDTGVLQ